MRMYGTETEVPVLRLEDDLRADTVNTLQFGPEKRVVSRGPPVHLCSTQDAHPSIRRSRLVHIKIAITGIRSDDVCNTFLALPQQVLLQQPQLLHHLPLDSLPDASIADPVKVFFQIAKLCQQWRGDFQFGGNSPDNLGNIKQKLKIVRVTSTTIQCNR